MGSQSFTLDKVLPLKALMALLIVADHLTFHVEDGWIQPFRELGAPIVSVFFFMSGYGLAQSYAAKGKDYLATFFSKRIWKVVLPAILSLLFFYLLTWNPARDFLGEWRDCILYGSPVLPYSWFVAVIVFLYVIFFLTYKYVPGRYRLAVLTILTAALSIIFVLVGYDRCWWVCNLAFPAGAIYRNVEGQIRGHVLLSLIVCLVGTMAFLLPGIPYLYPLCYVFIPTMAVLLATVIPIEKISIAPIAFIGGIAYEVYLCQGISMQVLSRLISNEILFILAVYAMTILLAWIVHILADAILKHTRKG